MPDKLLHIAGALPFLLISLDEHGNKVIQINKTRIFEAVLISCITGVIAGYISSYVSVREVIIRVDGIKEKVDMLDQRLWSIKENISHDTIEKFHSGRTNRNQFRDKELSYRN